MIQGDVKAPPVNLRIPACSADWRFLLPLDAQSSILVVTSDCDEYEVSFDSISVQNATQRLDHFMAGGMQGEPYDVVAIPLGVPADFSASVSRLLDGARRALKPSGTVLFGFANRWGLRGSGREQKSFSSTPREIERALTEAGFSPIEIYCAFPDLQTPEYVFSPLMSDLQFMLRRRYRHKLPAPLLSLLVSPLAARLLLSAVPSYYAVGYRVDTAVR